MFLLVDQWEQGEPFTTHYNLLNCRDNCEVQLKGYRSDDSTKTKSQCIMFIICDNNLSLISISLFWIKTNYFVSTGAADRKEDIITWPLLILCTLSNHGPVPAFSSGDDGWTAYTKKLFHQADKHHCNLHKKPWLGIYLNAAIIYTLLITSYQGPTQTTPTLAK